MGASMRASRVPKRFSLPMRDLIMLQPRFERRSGRRALRLLEHPRFRAAYDFLLLRAESGEIDPELADWWTELQELSPDDRIAEVEGRADRPSHAGATSRHGAASPPASSPQPGPAATP